MATSKRIYLDYNATTPVAKDVVDALLPYLQQGFGNASSSYALGQDAKRALEQARSQVATMLHASSPSEILFLSGGTESINYTIKGSAEVEAKASGRNHIITTCVEHVAVLETCKYLETKGYSVTYLPVDEFGRVSADDVVAALRPSTFLISVMLANNEVGTLQPVAEIVQRVKEHIASRPDMLQRVLFHTDASQAIGKIRVSVKELGVDFLTIAGHKLYAPKGIGALYIRADAPLPATQMHGASHEHGRRAGTENVAFNVALGTACEMISKNLDTYHQAMQRTRAYLLQRLEDKLAGTGVAMRVNGHPVDVLPNTLSVSFQNVSAVRLLKLIEARGVCASAGSACHSNDDLSNTKVSYVLSSMGVTREFALGTLRLSVGRDTTTEDLDLASDAIVESIKELTVAH
ncbi:hypothetical protein P43SY_002817 [Pythium insidiosum]|uniref:cysteine desulfurase n=1 Tax=Pythium insidiosum TaxID=114742 RepID=A0AAD5LSF1_PYTIN|nr:hypothetical protein P43SY_002817 [Pythium insidiosum]